MSSKRMNFTRMELLDMAARHARGESLRSIARVYGVGQTTVFHHIKHDGPRRSKGIQQAHRPSLASYRKHQRAGERPCPDCCAAHAQYMREYRAKRREAQAQ